MTTRFALALLALALVACGDNLTPGTSNPDAAVDAGPPPDANCPGRPAGQVGGPCTMDAQCDSAQGAGDGFCLHGLQGVIAWPDEGYCISQLDTCTSAPNSCGEGNVCVTLTEAGNPTPFKACLPACGSGECACANNQLCGDRYVGTTLAPSACIPGNPAAVDGIRCSNFGQCDQNSLCVNDSFEYPGGQCMQLGCTIGQNSTCTAGGDGVCIDPNFVTPGAACADGCVTDADCRTADGYVCYDSGAGKYCRHPQVGDPCTAEADCGNPAIWDCKTGAGFQGGYCTVQQACPTPGDSQGCPTGSSVCFDNGTADNYCVDRCFEVGQQSSCRTGYTCVDVHPAGNLTFGGCVPTPP